MYEAGSLKFDTKIDTKDFESGIEKLKRTAVKGTAAIGAAITTGIGAAVKVGADFEEAMSSVAAISMATGKDLDNLKNAAKEMGETTKYSATQAANALEYLSLAGYTAEESVQALPQVLNLAAAGGMDLAYASDLLTDSMAVMGLGIDSMENFSDQLAMAASKSNTNVQQLGEAVLVAGGQAKLANMSVSEMNTALGILADKGIKGSEGGTALRNTLKNLYTPTSNAADMLETLGVKTSNASGELLPMQDVLINLRDSLNKLSEADKMSAMSEIFDTRTIAAASALLDDCGGRWNELQGYLEDCDGAAAQMAETMNDNLKGQLVLAASAAEGLGIQVYESIQGTLKESVKTAAGEISDLTKSMKNGELAPAVKNIGKLFSSFADVTVKFTSTALPPLINTLGFVGEHLGGIATTGGIAVATFKTFSIVGTVNNLLKANNLILAAHSANIAKAAIANTAYTGQLTLQQTVLGVLTGKIKLAAAAQGIWNAVMTANPVGLVIAGVVALTAAAAALVIWSNKETEAEKNKKLALEEQKKVFEERKKEIEETTKAYEDLKSSQIEQASGDLAQIEHARNLFSELQNLADAQGRVDEKDRGRASFILNELNDAYGTEYRMIDGVIQGYSSMETAIDSLIEKKKWEIIQKAALPAYEKAITDEIKNRTAAADAEAKMIEKKNEVEKLSLEITKLQAEAKEKLAKSGLSASTPVAKEINKRKKELEEAKEQLKDYTEAYEESFAQVKNTMSDKLNYEEAAAAAEEGNFEKAVSILSEYTSGVSEKLNKHNGDVKKQREVIEKEYGNSVKALQSYIKNVADGEEKLNEDTLNKLVTHAQNMYNKGKEIGANVGDGMIKGLNGKKVSLLTAAKDICNKLVNAMKHALDIHSPSRVMRDEVGKYISLGVAAGIEESGDEVVKSFKGVLERLDYQKKFDIISEDEYYTELERLRDRYFKAGTKEWLEYTEKIYDYQQKLLEDEKKKLEETKKTYKDVVKDVYDYASEKLDAITKKQQDYSKKLKSYGKLFNNVTISLDEGDITYYSLADLKKDTQKLREYTDSMAEMKAAVLNSGISESAANSFFDEINSLSVDEGIKALDALKRANESELGEYLKAYEEKLQLADSASAELYKDDMKSAFDESCEYMKGKLTEAGFEVPKEFFDIGKTSADKFGEAFGKEISAQFTKIQEKLSDFRAKLKIEADMRSAEGSGGGTVVHHNETYSTNYSISSRDGADTVNRIKNYETVKRLAGV